MTGVGSAPTASPPCNAAPSLCYAPQPRKLLFFCVFQLLPIDVPSTDMTEISPPTSNTSVSCVLRYTNPVKAIRAANPRMFTNTCRFCACTVKFTSYLFSNVTCSSIFLFSSSLRCQCDLSDGRRLLICLDLWKEQAMVVKPPWQELNLRIRPLPLTTGSQRTLQKSWRQSSAVKLPTSCTRLPNPWAHITFAATQSRFPLKNLNVDFKQEV